MTVIQDEPTIGKSSSSWHEVHEVDGDRIVHRLTIGELAVESSVLAPLASQGNAKDLWWLSYLAGNIPTPTQLPSGILRTVDLFSGVGGLALGLRQLATELGVQVIPELAVDQDEAALSVYAANHGARDRSTESVSALIDYRIRGTADRASYLYQPELIDEELAESMSGINLVLAGPPCQGHSNLNNQTRRDDRRNALYLTVPAFAIAVGAPIAVIENVPAVVNDHDRVVETSLQLFRSAGYEVTSGVLSANKMGWPQTRKRHFMIARRDIAPLPLGMVAETLRDSEPRMLWWAIGDLEDRIGEDPMHAPTELSPENRARVDWLFDNDEYELALSERPLSHQAGTSYTSVYGRMRSNEPSPTITTGFMTPGRGRYVHPTRRRVLTAHEAARIQGFPDSYEFVTDPQNPPSKASLTKWIGDSVPMPLGYAASVAALGPGLPG